MDVVGLAAIDGWTIAAILVKAISYYTALLAMGGPMFLATFPLVSEDVQRFTKRITVGAALVLLVVLGMQFGVRSARISGMGFSGAVDPLMLGFVWESPLGTTALWKGAGAILIFTVVTHGPFGRFTPLIGSLLIAASFTFVGHSLGDPRWLLAILLIFHLVAAAFWVGALLPLHRAAHSPFGATLLHRFGIIAGGTVALLLVVGSVFAFLMIGSFSALFSTAYGWVLILKLTAVMGLMGLAAINKWRLVPALTNKRHRAADDLRRSIKIETILVGLILLFTAALTSITTPPVNL